MVVASRYFAFRALITQRTGIDFVSCLHNCREFSQTSLVFISGYANTENVFYCLIIWLCGGTLCGYFCWSGWPRAYSELNPTPHLTPKYLFRLSGFQALLLFIHFRYGRPEYLFTLHPGTQTMRYVTLNSVTEIAPPQPFMCVNRSPILYGFCTGACAKAMV